MANKPDGYECVSLFILIRNQKALSGGGKNGKAVLKMQCSPVLSLPSARPTPHAPVPFHGFSHLLGFSKSVFPPDLS